jgi:hypothetical protein
VLADEGFDGGGAVHVGDGNQGLVRAGFLELGPAFQGLIERRHVRHGAAGAHVGEDHADAVVGEDVRRFGHEVNAAEHDVFDVLLVRSLPRQLEGISREVGEIDDGVLLVVVAEDDKLRA